MSVAMGADKVRGGRVDRRRGADRGRHLVPDAHRRHAVARPSRRSGSMHLAEILASEARRDGAAPPRPRIHRRRRPSPGTPPFPKAARDGARRRPAADEPRRAATTTIRTKRARAVAERADWEELRAGRRGDQGRRPRATCPTLLEQLEANVTAAGGIVHWARDAAEANAIVADLVRDAGADEVVKVKSMATQEIELNEALARRGHRRLGDRPRRAHRPARATTCRRTSWSRRSTATGARSATSSSARWPRAGRPAPAGLTDEPARARRGRPAAPAREVPARQGRRLRRQLRRRRDRAPWWSSSPRATAGCA